MATLPVHRLAELQRLGVVDDVGDDVFGLAQVLLAHGRQRAEPEGRSVGVRHYYYDEKRVKSDLESAHIAVQFALHRPTLRLARSQVHRVADYGDLVLHRLPLPALVGGRRNAPRPYPNCLLDAYARGFGQRLEDCCFSVGGVTALESDALYEILLRLLLHWPWESAVLGYFWQRAEGPEGLGEVFGLAVILQLLLDGFQGRWLCPVLVLKLFRKSLGLLVLFGEVPLPAVGLLFMKRLAVLILGPSLDFLLGDPLDYFSLVEERQSLEIILTRGADEGFYGRFLAH